MHRILVLGGGFAGLWSAVGAKRKLVELGVAPQAAEVVLVDQNPYHNIRVRNYESDLSDVIVPLDDVLEPIGIRRLQCEVVAIDCAAQSIRVMEGDVGASVFYDRLVVALGSRLSKPPIPGLQNFAFDVDTYQAARVLASHLDALASRSKSAARDTVVIVGAGLTGLEVATEMPARLRQIIGPDCAARVILVDRAPAVGSDMGVHARPVIEEAVTSLGVELRLNAQIAEIGPTYVTLDGGEVIEAATTIWCGGMKANAIAQCLAVDHDRFGRVPVDEYMRVKGIANVFAAGDIAAAPIHGDHLSVMSCQHGRPMGRYAGHNVAADLFGAPLLPLAIPDYVTVVDLGPAGAIYTSGWDRVVVAQGDTAKQVKQVINRQRIYPPRNKDSGAILRAGAPVVQASPEIVSSRFELEKQS